MLRKSFKILTLSALNTSNRLIIVRNYAPRHRREPGIQHRIKDFGEDFIENQNDPEFVESLEADFMNLNKTHQQHEKEVKKMKDFSHTMLVGRKYFKEKNLNFLTYAEKEQIRKLHDEDPEKYTIDELSGSFPADPKTIMLIIRNRWQPKDTIRVQKHDESVKKNWTAFKEGKLELDQMLSNHLKKFAFRNFNHLAKPEPYRKLGPQVPKPKGNEFLSIITSCKKYAEKDEKEEEELPYVTSGRSQRVRKIESDETRIPEYPPEEEGVDNYKLDGRREFTRENITLDQLQKLAPQYKLKEEPKEITFEDHVPKFKTLEIPIKKTTAMSEFKAEIENAMDVQPYINIPKELRQSGKIYKLRDCFYSNDGEFLYRVPGLD